MKFVYCFCSFLLLFFNAPLFAKENILNVYTWSNYIPDTVIREFEKEYGIKVNLSTYENNEIMYTKIKANKNAGYDIIMPSGYFVSRMIRQHLLEQLDKTKLTNWKNLDPLFLKADYDPKAEYSVPYIWGITGIFYNKNYYAKNNIKKWSDLWDKQYLNQLLLLDDIREVFAMALLSLGYSANDSDPQHIQAAFLKLKSLMKNVKVFSSDTVVSILIDEDARLGMAWNGDVYKASTDNHNLDFVFPEEGFVIWVDTITIPKNAPHKETAYQFINFLLRPEIGKMIALYTNFPITNGTAVQLLPKKIRDNPIIYPAKTILRRGQFQKDINDTTLALYEKYWEELKMGG